MGFETGLSGLDANSRYLDAIGNNVSNSNVAGFKQSQLAFADIYANALQGGGSNQVGLGTQVTAIQQQFAQGGISATSNPLDLAINGNGFFKLARQDGATSFTRNGQFSVSKDGYIENAQGDKLQGYVADSAGMLSTATTVPLYLSSESLGAQATQTMGLVANLNAGSTAPTVGVFDKTNTNSYNNVTSMNTYDSLGNSHTVSLYFVKNAAITNGWDVQYVLDDGANTITPATAAIQFSSAGALETPASKTVSLDLTLPIATPAVTQTVSLDLSGLTQFGGQEFGVSSKTQDGYTAGRLTGFSADDDGIIKGSYSNGKTFTLGQVVLSTFRNPGGLSPVGSNQWMESNASGESTASAPGTGTAGLLQASALEESNVDLTKELVNMIVAQRAYQANAQTIKTQDQILSTLVNLR